MSREFAAYKAELRRVAAPLRLVGLLAVLAGAVLLIWATPDHPAARAPGFALLGLGWALVFYVIWLRSQWVKAHPFVGER